MFTYFLKQRLARTTLDSVPKFSFDGQVKYCKVVKVYDGDTITVNMIVNNKLAQFNVRLLGYDTPEIRTSNKEEKDRATVCRDFLADILLDRIVTIHCAKFDAFGRLLATVFIDRHDKVSVNDRMLKEGYGLAYTGGKKPEHDFSHPSTSQ